MKHVRRVYGRPTWVPGAAPPKEDLANAEPCSDIPTGGSGATRDEWQGMAHGAGGCVHHGSRDSTGRGGPRGCEGEWWLEWHTSHDQIEPRRFRGQVPERSEFEALRPPQPSKKASER